MFQIKECKKYLFSWVKSLLFKAKTLNFVEVLSGFKRDHVVCAYTVDGTGSRVLCLKITDEVTLGSLICSNISLSIGKSYRVKSKGRLPSVKCDLCLLRPEVPLHGGRGVCLEPDFYSPLLVRFQQLHLVVAMANLPGRATIARGLQNETSDIKKHNFKSRA